MIETKTTEMPLLLPIPKVCDTLGVGATTVRALVKGGELIGKKIGARLLIDAADLRRYVAGLPRTSGTGADH